MTEPRKRRLIQEEEEEDDDRARSPTSVRVNGARRADVKGKSVKRARRQEGEEEDIPEYTLDDDDDNDNAQREEPQGWDADMADSELLLEKDWERRALLEYERSKSQRSGQGMVAEVGVIEFIEMYDFMCHRHLKVPFGPKINFIIGHNGSGKSAILTAIMICLGGKANATNRAQSLKALIREGASQAEVRLQLRNRGPDAYKPEIYGESIIIERRISKEGASGYKIKSSQGKTIATKRDELSNICDHMNIQVDNPMNVLSQDTARQFLQSSTPEEKHKFFMRGTQLHQLSIDYNIVRDCIAGMQTTIVGKKEILPELHELAKAAQARFKDSQQAITLELKVESLKHQVAWAQIEDQEKNVKSTQEKLDTMLANKPKMERKRAQEEQAISELDGKITQLEKLADEHANSTVPNQEKKRQLEHELREKRNELKTLQDDERAINDEIKSLRDLIRGYDQQIEQEVRKLQANTHTRRVETESRIDKLLSEIEQCRRQLAEGRETLATLEQQVDERRGRVEHVNAAVSRGKRELQETKERIRQLDDQKQNSLRAFGPSMPEVLQAIQEVTERGGWRGIAPVGPLGRHVKLHEQRWAPVIESALGNVLNAFAVTTDVDRTTLFGILRRYRCNSDIVLTKKIIFDYRDKEPSDRFLTINRVLDFDDEWVRRLLIDKNSIESTILVEKRSDADRITSSGRDGGFPENVTGCFTIDLIRVGDRSGGAASIMMTKYRGPPRLTANVDQEQRELEGTVRKLEDSLRYRARESQDLMAEVESKDRERIQTKRQLANLDKEIKLKTRGAEDLKETLQDDEATKLHVYEESKQQTLAQIEDIKKQYEPIAKQKQVITVEMEPLKEQILQLNESIRSQEGDGLKIRTELDKLNMEKQGHIPKLEYWNKKMEVDTAAVNELQKELDMRIKYLEASGSITESTAKATEYCERVEVTATTGQLEREIKQIQDRLREQEARRGCSVEEIERDMRHKLEEYKSAKLAISQLERFVAVETEDQRSGKAGVTRDKDPKSLSGGEKSFSTICFLMALWDCMPCTIRCLDEFDVFMDAVNRRISMGMLIEFARQSSGVQYILITPQDASSVSPGPDVRVHRLHDPERNQQTLV
ncbi:Structural maintenance of chromosomes protein 6 [Mortierella sp. NVP85]|nr:Structural maintenance of chromosomes protein 6 [Mortierella sp. NVP85]